MKNKRLLILLLAPLMFFAGACKKSKKANLTVVRDELTKDSIFLYAKETYFWNTSLPDYSSFNPRSYSSFDEELFAITQYSRNPATGKPYEYNAAYPSETKYSFIDDGAVSTTLGGTGGDYGFSVAYYTQTDLRIKSVYGSSPAAAAGLKRGYKVTKLNGRILTNSTTDASFASNAIFGNGSSVTLTVKKPDGTEQDLTVNRGVYALNPILYTNTYISGTKKVGYIVFNSFIENITVKLQQAFSGLAAQGISELVVDLRYNGGGSVATATEMINMIAPAAQNGKVMYTTYFNETMQQGKAVILKNQKFTYNNQQYTYFDIDYRPTVDAGNVETFLKTGSLNVSRVYFLVSGSSASASELVINSLKPVMDVKLIGQQTYGKPVGFFALHIDKYDLYIPQFETRNQIGYGGYYDGLAVDQASADGLTSDFGDISELGDPMLKNALYYADHQSFPSVPFKTSTIAGQVGFANPGMGHISTKLEESVFKGMIGHPKMK